MLHLLHPGVVHFALAFVLTGALAEAAGILASRPRLERWGSTALLGGAGCLVIAVATGYLAANTAPNLTPAAEAALGGHERAALLAAGSLLLLLVWRALGRGRVPEDQRTAYALALLAVAALATWTALLGGGLVYEHGLGVGSEW